MVELAGGLGRRGPGGLLPKKCLTVDLAVYILPNMSSGVSRRAEVATLRATAHPLRLQMLSLLTGAAMSAADVGRELGITHANASYHLRRMLSAGLIVVAEQESVRGGKAKRYRYDVDAPGSRAADDTSSEDRGRVQRPFIEALAGELVRRSHRIDPGRRQSWTDAELWVDPADYAVALARVEEASTDLHRAARPPRTPGTVRVAAALALFGMTEDDPGAARHGNTATRDDGTNPDISDNSGGGPS